MNAELKSTNTLRFSTAPCNWILDFFTSRPKWVLIGSHTYSILVLTTRAPLASRELYCEYATDFTMIVHIINTNER